AAAETYMGLVEVGVGVIPGGGGTKEMTLRAAKNQIHDDIKTNHLREAYMNIAMAKVATSAHEAKNLGYLREQDIIVVNKDRQITQAKKHAIIMAEAGYTKPIQQKVKVLGKEAMGMFYVGSDQMVAGKYISDHDRLIANKLGYVMTGGNLSEPTEVSQQYLLDLEREAFLSLCGERKTMERIQQKVKVLGKEAMGMFYVGSDQMVAGKYISDHDRLIANKLGYVMTGGNLSEPTEVSQQYLLDLEREAFLSLCGERKTLERIQH